MVNLICDWGINMEYLDINNLNLVFRCKEDSRYIIDLNSNLFIFGESVNFTTIDWFKRAYAVRNAQMDIKIDGVSFVDKSKQSLWLKDFKKVVENENNVEMLSYYGESRDVAIKLMKELNDGKSIPVVYSYADIFDENFSVAFKKYAVDVLQDGLFLVSMFHKDGSEFDKYRKLINAASLSGMHDDFIKMYDGQQKQIKK